MSRYIRFHSEKQQINLLNCGKLDEWKDTCYNRQGAFIDVCSEGCKCDIYQDDRAIKWELDPNDYMCVNNDKWSVEKEYVLLNHVWTPTGDKRKKEIIEVHSRDCFVPQCEYVPSDDYYECVGYDKYKKNIKRCTKYEGGYDYYPDDFQRGELIERYSVDCGFDPTSDLIFEYSGDTPMKYTINNVEYTTEFSPLAINTKTKLGINSITDMYNMFYQKGGAINNITKIIKMPNSSQVTVLSSAFRGCSILTSLNLSDFNTSKVTEMRGVFEGCASLTSLDLSSFDTSNVTDMCAMYEYCSSLASLDLSNFNTSKVTDIRWLFKGCASLKTLDLSSFNTSNITNFTDLFAGCSSLKTLDLSNFNSSNVNLMDGLFWDCKNLTSINLSNWSIKENAQRAAMFHNCQSLTNITMDNCSCETIKIIQDQLVADKIIDNVTIYSNTGCEGTVDPNREHRWVIAEGQFICDGTTKYEKEIEEIKETPTSPWVASGKERKGAEMEKNSTDCGYAERWTVNGYLCEGTTKYEKEIKEVSTDSGATYNPTGEERRGAELEKNSTDCGFDPIPDLIFEYSGSTPMKFSLDGGHSKYHTDKSPFKVNIKDDLGINSITTMSHMFDQGVHDTPESAEVPYPNNITKIIKLPDSSKVINAVGMFWNCWSLIEVNFDSFITDNITDMRWMFHNCNSIIELNLSSFNTNKVKNMTEIFNNCSSLETLDLSNWELNDKVDLWFMFSGCSSIKTIYMRNCSQNTIDKIKAALAQCSIPERQVTIITQ